ncbi:hypothetical protein [Deinococcus yunweiensis]|uniref:hypothetical protein n=1 Tax=Deinococcus yunweiensis TaxID=367282 RepID=UPI00398F708E
MQASAFPLILVLALVTGCRVGTATSRDVDVTLAGLAFRYRVHSTVALPYGADLRVLLALIELAADDGVARTTWAALLRAADLGAGGRQQVALRAALERLTRARYTVMHAPRALGIGVEAFSLVDEITEPRPGEVRVVLGHELARQLPAARTAPPTGRDVPAGALGLYVVLAGLRRLAGSRGEVISLDLRALCRLLGLEGRGNNQTRTLRTMAVTLEQAGVVGSAEIDGARGVARLCVDFDVADPEHVRRLVEVGLSKVVAKRYAVQLGPDVPRCLARAREVIETYRRGGRTCDPVRLTYAVLKDPTRYGVALDAALDPVVTAPARPPVPVLAPDVEPEPVQPAPRTLTFIFGKALKGEEHDRLKAHLEAHPDRLGELLTSALAAKAAGDLTPAVERVRALLAS